jgi:hypothetical protein
LRNDSSQLINEPKKSEAKDPKEDGIGIPHIIIEASSDYPLDQIFKHPKFPQVAEVSDESKFYLVI